MFSNPSNKIRISSEDAAKYFQVSDQVRWNEFSENVVCELTTALNESKIPAVSCKENSLPNEILETELGQIYAFLAIQRQRIAKQLKHHPLEDFGTYRSNNELRKEHIDIQDTEIWVNQKDEIFNIVRSMTENMQMKKDNNYQFIQYNKEKYVHLFEAGSDDAANVMKSSVTILHTTKTTRSDDSVSVTILYPHADSTNLFHDFKLADMYFQKLKEWEVQDGIEDFLLNAGRLSHILACLLPVKRGNSAIITWLIDAIAKYKQIELGSMNNKKISWDMKALLTFSTEDYAQWYAKNAFVSVEVIADIKKSDANQLHNLGT